LLIVRPQKTAIAQYDMIKKIATDKNEEKSSGLRLEDFIGTISAERLREFIITQATLAFVRSGMVYLNL